MFERQQTNSSRVTEGNEQKLDFRMYREFRPVLNMTEIYEWKKELGKGQFGTVNEAMHKKAQLPVAIKTIKKSLIEARADGALIELMM